MKNKKNYKFLLSTLVLITVIFFNINHCQKTNASVSFRLNDVFSISSCQAENKDDKGDEDPIVCAPNNPDHEMTEEEFLELLRRKQI